MKFNNGKKMIQGFEGIKEEWKSKIEEHPLLTAVVINVLFFLLVFIFCEMKYETSDDYIMAAIMSGAYGGKPNPHMIYINIIWGYLLLPFYYIMPKISWYLISQLFLCLCSFIVITYVLLKKTNTAVALMVSILFITFFSDDAYVMVQFTKTSVLAIMSGSILFIQTLFHEVENKKRKIILSGLLVFAGSLIRFDGIFIAGGFLLPILVFEFIRLINDKNSLNYRKIGGIIAAGMVLIGTVVGAKALDGFIYNSDADYSYFRTYGSARSRIVDTRAYSYETSQEEYEEIGLSKNDYVLLRTWNFADPDFYNLELMEECAEQIESYQASQGIDRDVVKYDLRERNYWSYPSFIGCLILFMISVFFIRKCWSHFLLSAGIGYLYLYYFASSAKLVYRVEYGIFLCLFLSAVYFWDKRNLRIVQETERYKICIILIVLMCMYQAPAYRLNSWGKEVKGQEYKEYIEDIFFESWNYDSRRYRCAAHNEEAFSDLYKEMETHPESFYFMNFSTTIQTLYLSSNPLINEQNVLWKNNSFLAGVDIKFPDNMSLLDLHNVSNPIKSLLNEDVYLIDNFYQEEILTYIKEHYSPDASMTLYKTIDGFQIWKISSKL